MGGQSRQDRKPWASPSPRTNRAVRSPGRQARYSNPVLIVSAASTHSGPAGLIRSAWPRWPCSVSTTLRVIPHVGQGSPVRLRRITGASESRSGKRHAALVHGKQDARGSKLYQDQRRRRERRETLPPGCYLQLIT